MGKKMPMRKDGILARELGDEWLLYDPAASSVHIVNDVAAFVWRMCDGLHSFEQMEQKVADAYRVPEGTDVRAALHKVIQCFADRGMMAGRESQAVAGEGAGTLQDAG